MGTSYKLQLGFINRKWAVRLLKGKEVIACHIFKDIEKAGLPDGNIIIKWVLNTVPISINPHQIWKTVQILLKQANGNKEKKKILVPIK